MDLSLGKYDLDTTEDLLAELGARFPQMVFIARFPSAQGDRTILHSNLGPDDVHKLCLNGVHYASGVLKRQINEAIDRGDDLSGAESL